MSVWANMCLASFSIEGKENINISSFTEKAQGRKRRASEVLIRVILQ